MHNDLFGGYGPGRRYQRSVFDRVDEISKRGPEEQKDGPYISRSERDKARVEGAHLENDDIKDIFEDLEDLNEDLDDFYDPKSPLMAKWIKLDAELRWSPNVQKMVGMVADDLNIHSEKDFRAAAERVVTTVGEKIEHCPLLERLRKTSERIVRVACKNIEIGDLPTGKRMEWVNDLASTLYRAIKSERPSRSVDKWIFNTIDNTLRGIM